MTARTAYGLSTEPVSYWADRALCRDEDPELFFPIGTSGPALLQVEQAKRVCRRCPVVEECLIWAVQREQQGIAGGETEEDRRLLKVHRCESCERQFLANKHHPHPPVWCGACKAAIDAALTHEAVAA